MIRYRTLHDHKLIALCNWGFTPVKEIQKLRQKIRASKDLFDDYDAIIEVSHQEQWYSKEEIYMFSKSIPDPAFSGKKIAIVASSDIAYGLNRMYETMAKLEIPLEISVFRDTPPALTWLGREGIDIRCTFAEMMGECR